MPLPTDTHDAPQTTVDWPPSPEWEDAWDDLRLTDARLAKVTHAGRLSVIKHFAAWMKAAHDSTDPAEVTSRDIKEYLAAEEDRRTGSGVLNAYKALRIFFRHYSGLNGCEECADRDRFPSHTCRANAIHGVRRPKPSTHKTRMIHTMDTAEWAAVLKAAGNGTTLKSARDRAMLHLLGDSGLRRAELQALRISDVDLASRTVRIQHGKNDKHRVTAFSDDTAAAILTYMKVRTGPRIALRWMTEHPDEPMWVSTKGGRQLSYVQLGKIMTGLGTAAGVDLHTHMTRHMAADRAYREGMSQKDMMTNFGWSGRIPATYAASTDEERAVAAAHAMFKARKNGR
jgi:integrase/recombinase XerD